MIDSLPPKATVIEMVQQLPDTVKYEVILQKIRDLKNEQRRQEIGKMRVDFPNLLQTDFLSYNTNADKLAAEIISNYIWHLKEKKLALTPVQRVYISLQAAEGLIGNGGFGLVFNSLGGEMDEIFKDIQEIHTPSGEVFKSAYDIFKKYEEYFKNGDAPPEWEKDENHPDPEKLGELDSAWYALEKAREESAYIYFRQNKEGFELEKMKEYFKALKR